MKILSILILSIPLFSMDKEEVENIVNESVLNSIEGLISTIEVMVVVAGVAFTAFGVVNFIRKKQIKKELQEEIELSREKAISYIDELFRKKSKEIQDEMQEKMSRHMKSNINKSHKLSQHEEYLRNIIFIDLNKMLSNELNGSVTSEAFNAFADRYLIIAQLTSGDPDKTKKALHKLAIDSKRQISRLSSVKNYVTYIRENDISGEYLEYIENFEMI